MLCDWPVGTAITGIVTIGITIIGAGVFPIFGCLGAGPTGDGGIINVPPPPR
jgi:hypothetical protein